MRVTSELVNKRTFVLLSVAVSSLVFASSAYALTSSTILSNSPEGVTEGGEKHDISIYGNDAIGDAVSVEGVQITHDSTDDGSVHVEHTSNSSSTESTHSSASVQSNSTVDVHEASETQNSQTTESTVVVNEGGESNNDSNVRIRVRNKSDSSLNGDDQGGGGSFKLDIHENVTAE